VGNSTSVMSFGVLGPLLVELDGNPVRVGGVKPRLVLAMLLVNAGRIVSVDRLIDALWDNEPPEGAVNTLQAHVSHLRRVLADGDVALVTRPPGYQLRVGPDQVDLLRFEDLVNQARELSGSGTAARAAGVIRAALDLWRGSALEDLGTGAFAQNARTFLEERRLAATDDLLQLQMRLRNYGEVAQLCSELLKEHPLREAWWEVLMVALYRSGRPAEALDRYRQCREMLLDELGVEPMPRLQELQQQILSHDDRLAPGPVSASLVLPTRDRAPVGQGATTEVRAERLTALLVLEDDSKVVLGHRAVIGRSSECDVVLADPAVSRRHAEIRLANGRHLLLDLSSSNGTWLGGRPVLQHLLEDGDSIWIGEHRLRYRAR